MSDRILVSRAHYNRLWLQLPIAGVIAVGLLSEIVAAQATRARVWMGADAMRLAFVGQSLDGHYGNGTTWTETYAVDGRIDYRENTRFAKGRWHFRGDVFCTFYDPPFTADFVGGCWRVLATGANCYEFYTAGVQLPGLPGDESQADGNDLDAPIRWNARGWRTSEPSTCPEKPSV